MSVLSQIKKVKDDLKAWESLPDGNALKEAERTKYEHFANKLKDK